MATCVVSGVLQDVSGTAIANATIRCRIVTPYFLTTIQVMPTEPTVQTTASDGSWSQTLLQGANVEVSVEYPPGGLNSNIRSTYAIVVPAASTANFSTLAVES